MKGRYANDDMESRNDSDPFGGNDSDPFGDDECNNITLIEGAAMIEFASRKKQAFGTICLCLVLSILVSRSSIADELASPYPNGMHESKTFVRGEPSQIISLNIGPSATALWKRIQTLIERSNDIDNIAFVLDTLNASVSMPLDLVSPSIPGAQHRNDIKSNSYAFMIKSIDYGIGIDAYEKDKRFVSIDISLEPTMICISTDEVRRIYGLGRLGYPIGPHYYVPTAPSETPGMFFSESYGASEQRPTGYRMSFGYVNSGCVRHVAIKKAIH